MTHRTQVAPWLHRYQSPSPESSAKFFNSFPYHLTSVVTHPAPSDSASFRGFGILLPMIEGRPRPEYFSELACIRAFHWNRLTSEPSGHALFLSLRRSAMRWDPYHASPITRNRLPDIHRDTILIMIKASSHGVRCLERHGRLPRPFLGEI